MYVCLDNIFSSWLVSKNVTTILICTLFMWSIHWKSIFCTHLNEKFKFFVELLTGPQITKCLTKSHEIRIFFFLFLLRKSFLFASQISLFLSSFLTAFFRLRISNFRPFPKHTSYSIHRTDLTASISKIITVSPVLARIGMVEAARQHTNSSSTARAANSETQFMNQLNRND